MLTAAFLIEVVDRIEHPAAEGERVFAGRADHAGTTPMDARQDALVELDAVLFEVGLHVLQALAGEGDVIQSSGLCRIACRIVDWLDFG